MNKRMIGIFGSFGIVIVIALGAAPTPARSQGGAEPRFLGRMLVVVSDGDMQALAYQGDVLGPTAPNTLSVIPLDKPVRNGSAAAIKIANSVIGPPSALALTADGRYVIVAETKGPAPANRPKAKIADLPPGRTIPGFKPGRRAEERDLRSKIRPARRRFRQGAPVRADAAFGKERVRSRFAPLAPRFRWRRRCSWCALRPMDGSRWSMT